MIFICQIHMPDRYYAYTLRRIHTYVQTTHMLIFVYLHFFELRSIFPLNPAILFFLYFMLIIIPRKKNIITIIAPSAAQVFTHAYYLPSNQSLKLTLFLLLPVISLQMYRYCTFEAHKNGSCALCWPMGIYYYLKRSKPCMSMRSICCPIDQQRQYILLTQC